MPYRETQIEQLMEANERLERALERKEEEITRLKNEVDSLEEDPATARSRRRGFFGSADREKLEEENARLQGEIENLNNECGDLHNEIDRLTECSKHELREATALRAHAIAVELVHAHLRDPEWLPHGVAAKMIDDSGLAGKVMELQREREAVTNAENDVGMLPKLGHDAKELIQLLIGPSRHTIILPLRHGLTAIRAAVECWGQEVMEKANALKGGLT